MMKIFVFKKKKSREHQCGRGTFQYSIIAYKSLTGNYSKNPHNVYINLIIAYKSLTGNYSVMALLPVPQHIIAYKSLTGNYSYNIFDFSLV